MYDEDTANAQDWQFQQSGKFLTPLVNPYYGWPSTFSGVSAVQLERVLEPPGWPPQFLRRLFGMDSHEVDSSMLSWSLTRFKPSHVKGATTYGHVTASSTPNSGKTSLACSRSCLAELRVWAQERRSWSPAETPLVPFPVSPLEQAASVAGLQKDDVPLWNCCRRVSSDVFEASKAAARAEPKERPQAVRQAKLMLRSEL